MKDLSSVKTIKSLLAQHHIQPHRGLGQNFLTDKRVLEKTLLAAELKPKDTVLEIGPGLGTLTQALAQKARKVVAIEKDFGMVKILQETLLDSKNVQILHADILRLSLAKDSLAKLRKNYKVVANLPYYITSPAIRKFLEAKHKPKLMVLMVQKEVAQRICARPAKRGEARPSGAAKPPHMSLLAVSVQFYAKPKIVSYVNKKSFWPVPKVDSAILKLVPTSLARLRYPKLSRAKFFEVVKAGFKQPRKQLINNLPKSIRFPNGISPTQRAETLSLQNWIALAQSFQKV